MRYVACYYVTSDIFMVLNLTGDSRRRAGKRYFYHSPVRITQE